jgi:hypothetical protein
MRVAPPPSFRPIKAPGSVTSGGALLVPAGARVALGWDAETLAAPIVASASSLFGPRGVCLHTAGSLWVCDTGHHRLLGWSKTPSIDNTPADIIVGQPDFAREGRNAKGWPSAATLNVPTGVTAWKNGLAVADAWNHRVLLWRRTPHCHQPADIVLGQTGDAATLANRGADRPSAATLYWPYGVAEIGGMLAVADTGNRRVLIWRDPSETGQPADIVLGQSDALTRHENAGRGIGAFGMRWPHGLAVWRGMFAVADAGNNRIMLWNGVPTLTGTPCDSVLGQADPGACDHNRSAYYPSNSALNMPYALAVAGTRLMAADAANSRLVGYAQPAMGAPADRLSGQCDFASKGDNRWGQARRDSLCWPYGLSVAGTVAAVADSGNNRVLLWDIAS